MRYGKNITGRKEIWQKYYQNRETSQSRKNERRKNMLTTFVLQEMITTQEKTEIAFSCVVYSVYYVMTDDISIFISYFVF